MPLVGDSFAALVTHACVCTFGMSAIGRALRLGVPRRPVAVVRATRVAEVTVAVAVAQWQVASG